MTLGDMHEQGVQHLLISCLNDNCRHTALIDISSYPAGVEITALARRMKCGKCGGKDVDGGRIGWRGWIDPHGCDTKRTDHRSSANSPSPLTPLRP
jgi:hypothetical protein